MYDARLPDNETEAKEDDHAEDGARARNKHAKECAQPLRLASIWDPAAIAVLLQQEDIAEPIRVRR